MKARVIVTLKSGILDPQGKAIEGALRSLGVSGIVRVGGRDAREEILVAFARKQIAVLQRLLAEIGEQVVAAVIDLDRIGLGLDRLAVMLRSRG